MLRGGRRFRRATTGCLFMGLETSEDELSGRTKAGDACQSDGESHRVSSTRHLGAKSRGAGSGGVQQSQQQHDTDAWEARRTTSGSTRRGRRAMVGTGKVNAVGRTSAIPGRDDLVKLGPMQHTYTGQRGGLTLDAVEERLSACLGMVSGSLSDRLAGSGGRQPRQAPVL